MKHKSLKNILYFVIALSVGALCVYGFLFYTIKSHTETSSKLTQTLELDQGRNQRFDEIENTIKNIEDRAERLEGYTLEKDNIVEFLSLLEGVAREQGVLIGVEIKENETKKGSNKGSLGLTYTFSGRWNSVQNFLAMIENLPYTITMEAVSIRKEGSGGGWGGTVRFQIVTT